MVSKEHPEAAERLFEFLASQNMFSPLNNVEAIGIAGTDVESIGIAAGAGEIKWRSLKGSWNLALQTLGAGRSLPAPDDAPRLALAANAFLNNSYRALISNEGGRHASVSFVCRADAAGVR